MEIGSNSCKKTLRARAQKLNARAVRLGRSRIERVNSEDLMAILAIYGEECFYCGHRIYFGGVRANGSFDHVVPLGRGGKNVKKNLVPACTSCNNRKGDRVLVYERNSSGGRVRFRHPKTV